MKYEPYAVNQAQDIFHLVDFEPRWLIDCGPGFGQEAKRFRERWPNITIIGLEPCRAVYEAIADDYPGTLLEAAAWNNQGSQLLHSPDALQGSSLVCENPKAAAPVPVPTVTIDYLDKLHGGFQNAVLWADVEMSELQVLEGAQDVIIRGGILLANLEVHQGERETLVDAKCLSMGLRKVFSYAGNGLHHDNVYKRRLPCGLRFV